MRSTILLLGTFLLTAGAFAQNVGINSTGAAPNASAMLDVVATNKGFLLPRVALTGTTDAVTISSPANWLIVFNTATASDVTPGMYYWDGAKWVRMLGNADAWKTLGNTGTVAATNFLGTTDAIDLVFRTNNTEKVRILSGGSVGIGVAAPTRKLHLDGGNATATHFKISAGTTTGVAAGDGLDIGMDATGCGQIVQWENNDIDLFTNATWRATNWSDGAKWFVNGPLNDDQFYVESLTNTRNRGAEFIYNENTTNGNGLGSANIDYSALFVNGGSTTYTFGSAGFFQPAAGTPQRSGGVLGNYMTGVTSNAWGALGYRSAAAAYIGVYGGGIAPLTGIAGGYSSDGNVNYSIGVAGYGGMAGSWSRGHVIGNINHGDMISSLNIGDEITSGKNIEIVQSGDKRIPVYTTSSTENQIYKSGTAKLINGKAVIRYDETLKNLIDPKTRPIITVTAMGKSGVLYIEQIDANSFTVAESGDMNSTVEFNWILMANRIDGQDHYIAPEMLDADFDKNVIGTMTNEMDPNVKGNSMWFDGEKIRFDAMPEDKEIKNGPQMEVKKPVKVTDKESAKKAKMSRSTNTNK